MSWRVRTSLLLFLISALSCGAVFAVHAIEQGKGSYAEPFATRFYSPVANSDENVVLTFRTQNQQTVDVFVVDNDNDRVAQIANDLTAEGSTRVEWDAKNDDGDVVDDGAYRFVINPEGDAREYGPATPTEVDSVSPQVVATTWTLPDSEEVFARARVVTEATVRFAADGFDVTSRRARAKNRNRNSCSACTTWILSLRKGEPDDARSDSSVQVSVVDYAGNETAIDEGLLELIARGPSA